MCNAELSRHRVLCDDSVPLDLVEEVQIVLSLDIHYMFGRPRKKHSKFEQIGSAGQEKSIFPVIKGGGKAWLGLRMPHKVVYCNKIECV